jgi:hypothetical protein
MAAMPTGTFTQKIQCHESVLVRTPPTRGPAATPRPAIEDQMPRATPRLSGGYAFESSVSVSGMRMALPAP